VQPQNDITVVIVEDRETIRKAMELIIDGTSGMICAATFPDAESLLATDEYPRIDVVLLDIGLPGQSGVEAIRPIRAHWPSTTICMLTVHDDEDLIFEALCRGATGYLLKNTPPAQILEGIREMQAGGAPMSASVAR
jgi:DNA-binding NarL/FixJ family response regulator